MINKLAQQDWVKNKQLAKLRVEVKAGGCSGFEYDISIDDQEPQEDDM